MRNPANCWTIDEFREVAKQLTTDDIYGVYGLETVADTLNAQLLSNGATRYNEDYTESTINSPEAKEVFETIKAIRVEGWIRTGCFHAGRSWNVRDTDA